MTQRLRSCLVFWSLPLGAALYQLAFVPILALCAFPLLRTWKLTLCAALVCAGWSYARIRYVEPLQVSGTFVGTVVKEPIGPTLTVHTQQGTIRTTCQPIWPPVRPGDYAQVTGSGKPVPKLLAATATRDRVVAYLPRANCTIAPQQTLRSIPLHVRQRLEKPLLQNLPEPEGSFVAGLVLGSRQLLSQNLKEALQVTGTAHLVAVSGANVTLLLGALKLLIPAPPRVRLLIALLASVAIILITGASSAVVRGATMAFLTTLTWFYKRQVYPAILLAVAACAITLYNPLIPAHDGSFQFSFAAFSALLFLTPLFTAHLLPRLNWAPELLRNHFLETLAATIGTLPVSYWKSGSISPLGLLVNPLVLWLVPVVTLGGALLMILGNLPLVGVVLGFLLVLPARFILRTITIFS